MNFFLKRGNDLATVLNSAIFVSVSAMLVDTRQKKISLKLLFLSDIFLFPFVRQQFPVLA